jgi:hypothetical protein
MSRHGGPRLQSTAFTPNARRGARFHRRCRCGYAIRALIEGSGTQRAIAAAGRRPPSAPAVLRPQPDRSSARY